MHLLFHQGEEFAALIQPMVASTIEIYDTIARELLPTPAKSHYTFNLRDLAKVFQGILSGDPKSIRDSNGLVRLWVHECSRVFSDRLVNDEDRKWFADLRDRQLSDRFEMSFSELCQTDRLMFGDYLSSGDAKPYTHIEDLEAAKKTFESYLEDYNAESTKPMHLVLFMDAIEHVSRISRIIRQPKGNALLLGVGGSGRQSLTRLAAFAAEYKCFQIEITKNYGMNEWREDLRNLLKQSGMDAVPTVFLLPDTQIIKEAFLEDVNAILNSGDVPNIFDAPTKEEINSVMRPINAALGLAQTKAAMYAQFLSRVQSNLHVVLAMSPGSDLFRSRLRMYPSLLNCCSIDWFSEWPDEALTNVARQGLVEITFADDNERDAVFDVCRGIHQSVARESVRFLNEQGRFNAVTPTSYLELLASYQKIMKERKADVGPNRQRFVVGLEKLADATKQVEQLQEDIVKLQPVLVKTSAEVDEMMINISEDRAEADKTKAIVSKQEEEAGTKAAEAKSIADDAQKDLDEALPALDAATKSLKSLNKGDIVEVKAMKNPPAGVRLTMECVCILFKVKPVRKDDPNQLGKKINDYWEPASKLLNDPTAFLNSLFEFDKDAMEEGVINHLTPYIEGENGEFTPAAIAKASVACKSICQWCLAMHKYYNVAKMVEPKKQLLAGAQAELKVVMEQLEVAKNKLKAVNEKLDTLEASLNAAVSKKEELAKKSEECTIKLGRAEKLIGGLGGEKLRWIATVEKLGIDLHHIMGDVLISAGSVAYLGAFTADFRRSMVNEWNQLLESNKIPHTPECTIHTTLADPVSVRAWQIAGLPSDELSTENALILRKARRWPLMIDPETQANSWVRTMERPNNIEVVKLSSATYLRSLENCIRFGKPILMESILEDLDPALEPLLLRSTFKQSGQEMIQLGDSVVPWNPDFRFYMTTKLRNPTYKPETAVKVTLLNFAITSDGLQQQLLGLVVAEERPDLAEAKNNLVVQNAQMKKQMQDLEATILRMLSEASGDILDDESLINTLDASKKTSEEIKEKLVQAEVTEKVAPILV
jgi:dynein heavy chain